MVVLKRIIFSLLCSFVGFNQLQSTDRSTNSYLYSHSSTTANGTSAVSTVSSELSHFSSSADCKVDLEELNAHAQDDLAAKLEVEARLYELGEKNTEQICKIFNRSNGEAHYLIGIQCFKGIIESNKISNLKLAFSQFINSAKRGFAKALNLILKMLELGNADVEQLLKDISWLEKLAVASEDPVVVCILSKLIAEPKTSGVVMSRILAVLSGLKSISRISNQIPEVNKAYALGIFKDLSYRAESLGNKSPASKTKFFKNICSMQTTGDMAFLLAQIYYQNYGISKDPVKECEYLKIAAEKKHPEAMFLLGMKYFKGEVVDRNEKKGKKLVEGSARLGFTRAQYNMGVWAFDSNFTEAYGWLKISADQGHGDSLAVMGQLQQMGIDEHKRDIEPDCEKAFKFYRDSADQGSFQGMMLLANFYNLGLADKKDTTFARRLFDKILQDRTFDSSYWKAFMYEFGLGVKINLSKAKKYYSEVMHYDKYATQALKRIEEHEERAKKLREQNQKGIKEKEKIIKKKKKKKIVQCHQKRIGRMKKT